MQSHLYWIALGLGAWFVSPSAAVSAIADFTAPSFDSHAPSTLTLAAKPEPVAEQTDEGVRSQIDKEKGPDQQFAQIEGVPLPSEGAIASALRSGVTPDPLEIERSLRTLQAQVNESDLNEVESEASDEALDGDAPPLEVFEDPDEETEPEPPNPRLNLSPILQQLQEDAPIPEYLNADPNPLLFPTRPEEVEVIGAQPVTLEQALELARRNSRELQAAVLELERAQAELREVRAQLYPNVQAGTSLTGAENQNQNSALSSLGLEQPNTDDINWILGGTVELSYDLYTGGRRPALIEAAEEQVEFNEFEVERLKEQLRLTVATNYYDLQEADELVRISAASLDEALQSRRDAVIREQAGVGTRFDVLQADVQVANAQQELTQARSQQAIGRRELSRTLNIPPQLTLAAVPAQAQAPWPLSLPESIVLAFQNRSELRQQLTQRRISELQRRAAIAAVRPQVSLFANYDVQNLLNDENEGFSDTYRFGAQLSWLLFDGGAARARATQQELNSEIAEAQFADTLNAVRLEVEQAFYNQEANRANIDTAQVAVNQADEALRLARLRFQAGVGTQLDVISAQSELTRARGNLIRAVIGYNRAIAALERAVSNLPGGRLLDPLEIPPQSEFINPLNEP